MNFFADLMSGGVEGLAKGAGQLVKDIRTAVTGKEPLSAEMQAAILARADAMEAAALSMEAQAAQGQIDLNKIDAQSGSMFKGGWRPAAGWVCVIGLGYTFLLRPVLPWVVSVTGMAEVPELPPIETMDLMVLLSGMLGLGGMRSFERARGKA